MPYIITTRTDVHGDGLSVDVTGRTAVATLDEAQRTAHDAIKAAWTTSRTDRDAWLQDATDLPESGGTVGPLPDGTVIEVRKVPWAELVEDLHADTNNMTCGEALVAFNAA